MQNLAFSDSIINWYRAHKRDLPWRKTANPYHIWISEIILQQTRVDQGLSYYHNILKAFPTVADMALADEDELLKLWQGLGYYSRARNMHATAQVIHKESNGNFPTNYRDLLQLKGIGPYTAAAIASFCYKEPVAVVDGNVERVLSRFYGFNEPVDSAKAKKTIQLWAQENLAIDTPDLYNQAIMEFGALQCTPKAPKCSACVLFDRCMALRLNLVENIPFKSKKTKVKLVYIDYFVHCFNDGLTFRKREQAGIWENLFDFPGIESDSETDKNRQNALKRFLKVHQAVHVTEPVTHLLSHRKLIIRFYVVKGQNTAPEISSVHQALHAVDRLAVPRPIQAFLEGAKSAHWWGAFDV